MDTITTQPTTVLIEDRIAICDVIGRIGLHADQREWAALEACFDDQVTTDYVSLFGGDPVCQAKADLIAAWRSMLPGFDATQHFVATTEVVMRDADHAIARSNVRATHRLDDALWIVGGLYTHELARTDRGWRATAMRFTLAFEEGDRNLVARAAERAHSAADDAARTGDSK
jgi:hypothetical protein